MVGTLMTGGYLKREASLVCMMHEIKNKNVSKDGRITLLLSSSLFTFT